MTHTTALGEIKSMKIERYDCGVVLEKSFELIREAWGIDESELIPYMQRKYSLRERIKEMFQFFREANIYDVAYNEKTKQYAIIGPDTELYVVYEDGVAAYKSNAKRITSFTDLGIYENDKIKDSSNMYHYRAVAEYDNGFVATGFHYKRKERRFNKKGKVFSNCRHIYTKNK
jgi:hypothetical protein